VAVTPDGKTLYVADSNNHTIRRITFEGGDPASPLNWSVYTIAGLAGSAVYAEGTGDVARFNFPVGIAVNPFSGTVYVSELSGNRVRRLQPARADLNQSTSWVTSLVAGSSVSPVGTAGNTDGFGTSARFDLPAHLALDGDSNLYVADVNNSRIRKIQPDTNVSTLAGSDFGYKDASGTAAQFGQPNGVAVDSAGYVYVADTSSHRIRRVSPTGVVTTIAGTGDTFPGDVDGPGNVARFYFPQGIAADPTGTLYVVSGGTYLFAGGGGVTSPGLRVRLIQRILK
jgi:sugar lactone lactonase YvrE